MILGQIDRCVCKDRRPLSMGTGTAVLSKSLARPVVAFHSARAATLRGTVLEKHRIEMSESPTCSGLHWDHYSHSLDRGLCTSAGAVEGCEV